MKVVIIDNYDSFTYNLHQVVLELGHESVVIRNDETTLDELRDLQPDRIILSPGPGKPDSAGITLEVVAEFSGATPLFGVCLGHQAMAQAFGAKLERSKRPLHGKISSIYHSESGIFAGLPNPFQATRYHSLVVDPETLPACFEVTARTLDETVMGIRHRFLPVNGVQFHPESIATPEGRTLIKNFLDNGGLEGVGAGAVR